MVFRPGLCDPCTRDIARLWKARENTRTVGECIFALSESRATSQVHGSRNPAQENHLVLVLQNNYSETTN